jgi:hypothetical protein
MKKKRLTAEQRAELGGWRARVEEHIRDLNERVARGKAELEAREARRRQAPSP